MSHAVEQMFYVGETPWHGLGVKLDSPPTIRDAIVAAGLDWEVVLKPLCRSDNFQVQDCFATVRSSDDTTLGIVGARYTPIQNIQAFDWFEPFITSGQVVLETAGSLHNGRQIWVLARINRDPIEVASGDAVGAHLLLSSSHDGSSNTRVGFTPIRVVCANTLGLAHSAGVSKLLRVRHTKSAPLALREIQGTIDAIHGTFSADIETMRRLTQYGCNVDDLRKYVSRVFRSKDSDLTETASETAVKSDRLFNSIEPLFQAGIGNKGETLWDAFNGVTQYLSWERGRTQDTRLSSLWLGDGAKLADRALSEALAMAV